MSLIPTFSWSQDILLPYCLLISGDPNSSFVLESGYSDTSLLLKSGYYFTWDQEILITIFSWSQDILTWHILVEIRTSWSDNFVFDLWISWPTNVTWNQDILTWPTWPAIRRSWYQFLLKSGHPGLIYFTLDQDDLIFFFFFVKVTDYFSWYQGILMYIFILIWAFLYIWG